MAISWLYLLISPAAAQLIHQWTRQRGGEADDRANSLQVDADGNAWVAGYTESSLDGHTNAGSRDIFLMRFDAQGVHQWTRQRGGEKEDYAQALQVDAVGNAWLAGYTYSSLDGNTNAGFNDIFLMRFDAQGVDRVGNAWVAGYTLGSLDGNTNAGWADIFLMKFDAQGVHQWTRQRGGERSDYARALQVDAKGNVLIAGETQSSLDGHSNAGDRDMFLMKFDAQGVHQWTQQRGGATLNRAWALQVDAKGNALVAGSTQDSLDGCHNAGDLDAFLMKFDAQGVHEWTRLYGGEYTDEARALQVDEAGNSWVAGATANALGDGATNAGSLDIFLMKCNAQGVPQWITQRGGKKSDEAEALQVDGAGQAWVAGNTWSSLDGHSHAGRNDVFLMKFDAQGAHQWTRQRGSPSDDVLNALKVDGNGNCWLAGWTNPGLDAHNYGGAFLMKFLAGDDCSQATCPAGYARSPSQSGGDITCCVLSSTLSSTSAEAQLLAFTGSQLEVELQESTTTAVDLETLTKPWMSNAQLIDLGLNTAGAGTSNEDDSTGLLVAAVVAAVVLPLLTACLCAALGIWCYRTKLRQLQGAEAEVPNPLAMLPPLARSVKPLIFSWDSRMTAEWPRGKVQKLSVGEAAFELSGRQFQFRPGQVRHFAWEDGTVQTVQSIQKTLERGVVADAASPSCLATLQVGLHSKMPRCASCSRFRAAGKHWCCKHHQAHVCPVCAELPPEMPTLGMGYNRTCPRDGRPHCSIVDALEDAYSGKVTHFVSWCWAYSLNSVVSAIKRWLHKSNEDAQNVFLWMCFFCNNQYRIKEEAAQTGSDELREIFESHLVEAGHMLVLLDTIVAPTYVTRAWCIFESYVCIAQEIPMNIILPDVAENFFRETMCTGRIDVLSGAVSALNVRHARAGSEKDEDLIKQIILNTTGFDAVNHAVRSRLIDQLTNLFRELLTPQPS
eukprot:s787_g4.t1